MFVGDCANAVLAIRGRVYVKERRGRADLHLLSLEFAVGYLTKRDNANLDAFFEKTFNEGYVTETMLTQSGILNS